MYSHGITLPQARQVIRDTIQIFGVERTIYGSNFPLEKLHASYADFYLSRAVRSPTTACCARIYRNCVDQRKRCCHDNGTVTVLLALYQSGALGRDTEG